jgi:UDP-glucose 4-epimerase
MTSLTTDVPHSSPWRGARCLITGGLGFIGSSLAIRLAREGAKVTIADALLPDAGGNLFNIAPVADDVVVNFCDVRDENVMAHLVRDVQYVFHVASQVSHVRSLTDPYPDIDINIKGTTCLMEALRKNNRDAVVIRTGTRGQYGPAAKLPVSEDHPTNPKGIYELTQLTAEKMIEAYHQLHGIPCVLLRISNIYGPRAQMKWSHCGVANWLVRLALDGKPITIFGDGQIKRDFVYIDDCVAAVLGCAANNACHGQAINVGSDIPCSFLELARTICRHVPGAQIVHTEFTAERKTQEPGDFYSDITRIGRLTGWRPTTALDDGVRRTVEFYTREREHYW